MKKIIVPTDFSYTSKDALNFAIELAPILNASIKVVNIYSGMLDVNQPLVIHAGKGHIETINDQLENFINYETEGGDTAIQTKVKIEYEAIQGIIDAKIIDLSNREDTEMIVMGTTGTNGVVDKLFGTVSIAVSRKAFCPVLLIPNGVTYKGFKDVLFTSNYESTDATALKKIVDFASLFQSVIHFIHIRKEKGFPDYELVKNRILDSMFKDGAPTFAFEFSTVNSDSVIEGIRDYIQTHKVDLTVMVAPHRNFWLDLLHKSTTKAIAFNTSVPILVYHT